MLIQFIKDTTKAVIKDYPKGTIIVCHEMYSPPILEGVEVIPWQKFKSSFSEIETPCIILVGVNRMISPSNRCDMVNDYLQTMTPNIIKYCIDTAPFIGEPWRLWFHYSVAFSSFMGVNYSYPIEGEWQKWFYREERDCRLSGDNIKLFLRDTYCDLDRLTTAFEFYEVRDYDEEWYQEAKAHVFEKYSTPKLLVSNLLKLSNAHFQLKIDYDSYLKNVTFRLPDIGVYRFMAEENKRRLDIYNAFCNENI